MHKRHIEHSSSVVRIFEYQRFFDLFLVIIVVSENSGERSRMDKNQLIQILCKKEW